MFGKFDVEAAHDESNDGLADQTEDHGVFRTEGVDDEGADNGSRDVKGAVWRRGKRPSVVGSEVGICSLNDDTPSEDGGKGVIPAGDIVDDGSRV